MSKRIWAGIGLAVLLGATGCGSDTPQSGKEMSVKPEDSGMSAGAPKPGAAEKTVGEGGGRKIGK